MKESAYGLSFFMCDIMTAKFSKGAAMDKKESIREDFDRLSVFSERPKWEHNTHYHRFLMRHIPKSGKHCLEIGCGAGDFSRLLSKRFDHVDAIDLSPGMLQIARVRSQNYTNISYIEGDFLDYPLFENHYDCICSIATVHHLPLDAVLEYARKAIKPGGVLAILDLYKTQSIYEWLISTLAVPINKIFEFIRNKGAHPTSEEQEAWRLHMLNDHYLTAKEIRSTLKRILPGAVFRYHLYWRYSIIYQKQ